MNPPPTSSPSPSIALPEDDVRSIIRILSDLAGSSQSLADKRKHLVESLAKLVEADAFYWALMGNQTPGEHPTLSVFLKGGFTEENFAQYLKTAERPEMKKFVEPFFIDFAENGKHITRLYQQIDKEGRFPSSESAIHWNAANLGGFIFSLHAAASGQHSGVALFRYAGKQLFTEREARLTHILLSEVAWLHDTAWPEHPAEEVFRLSPRLHTVLNLLLQGHGRKEIAAQIGISQHTLGDYIKDIYSRFRVNSQASLISRFHQGDGGDGLR